MDLTAFYKMTYGLYILSSSAQGKDAGCIVNTVTQVTAEPPKLAVAVNKQNTTAKIIQESGVFAAVPLTQEAGMDLIGVFGFRSSETEDKFAGFHFKRDEAGVPYVTDCAAARFSAKVEQTVDLGTHLLFIGEVTEAEKLLPEEPMSYAYYHSVVKGGTPKTAPSYKGEAEEVPVAPATSGERWRCTVCGYIHEGPLPEGFTCPLCGVGVESFEKLESEPAAAPERWRCTVCGYIHEGPLPEGFTCPICGVGADKFEKLS